MIKGLTVGKAAFHMSKKTLAELLVETLAFAGVERIYGVAGDSLNGITDSIRKRDDIRWVSVRHEETAAFAAGAEAQSDGTPSSMCWKLRAGQSPSD